MNAISRHTTLDWTGIRDRVNAIINDQGGQRATAEASGVKQASLSLFVSGKSANLAYGALEALAKLAGRDLPWMMFGTDATEGTGQSSGAQSGGAGDTLRLIAWADLVASPLNPRKFFDPEALTDLASAILAQAMPDQGDAGVLQNLVARPHPTEPGKFEIAAGERRYRAVGLNIDAGHYGDQGAQIRLPVKIGRFTDAELLSIAIAENRDRKDVRPLEEARGYQALKDLLTAEFGTEAPASTIAERTGVHKRLIQLRLELVEKLAPSVQDALDAGKITLAMARVLTTTPKDWQVEALVNILTRANWGWDSPENVARSYKNSLIPASKALFKSKDYTDDVIMVDGKPYYANAALFDRLQGEAIAAKADELSQKYKQVRIFNDHFPKWQYDETKTPGEGFAVIQVVDRQVTVMKGFKEKPRATAVALPASETASGTAAAPVDLVTQKHLIHARQRKTAALQNAIAGDQPVALRLAIWALLGCGESVRIATSTYGMGELGGSDSVAQALDTYRERLVPKDAYLHSGPQTATILGNIMALSVAEAKDLFALLVASLTFSITDYKPDWGDKESAVAIADILGLIGNEERHGMALQREDLEGIRRAGLERVAQGIGLKNTPDKVAALQDAIAAKAGLGDQADLDAAPDYVLPSLRFGTPDAVRTAFATARPHKTTGKKPVPAGPRRGVLDQLLHNGTPQQLETAQGGQAAALEKVCDLVALRVATRPPAKSGIDLSDLMDDLQTSDFLTALELEADREIPSAERDRLQTLGACAAWLTAARTAKSDPDAQADNGQPTAAPDPDLSGYSQAYRDAFNTACQITMDVTGYPEPACDPKSRIIDLGDGGQTEAILSAMKGTIAEELKTDLEIWPEERDALETLGDMATWIMARRRDAGKAVA